MNHNPGTICFNSVNDENRPIGFLTLVSVSTELEISQNPVLGKMSQNIRCNFHFSFSQMKIEV